MWGNEILSLDPRRIKFIELPLTGEQTVHTHTHILMLTEMDFTIDNPEMKWKIQRYNNPRATLMVTKEWGLTS